MKQPLPVTNPRNAIYHLFQMVARDEMYDEEPGLCKYKISALFGFSSLTLALIHAVIDDEFSTWQIGTFATICLSFYLKIEYMWDKRLARDILLINTIGWACVVSIMSFRMMIRACHTGEFVICNT